MIYIIIFISILFLGIGSFINKKNADDWVNIYDNNPEKKEQYINLTLPFFKKFHKFLGISLFVLSFTLKYTFGEEVTGVFLVVYILLAYIYFAYKSNKLAKGLNVVEAKIIIAITFIALAFFIGTLFNGYKENQITIKNNRVVISGMYGEEISFSEIDTIMIIESIPKIKLRSDGFSLGSVNKGYYLTQSNETIKLLLNSENKPYLLIIKNNGNKVYLSTINNHIEDILTGIKKHK